MGTGGGESTGTPGTTVFDERDKKDTTRELRVRLPGPDIHAIGNRRPGLP